MVTPSTWMSFSKSTSSADWFETILLARLSKILPSSFNVQKFPLAATLYTFADDVNEEGLKKWLNNQHSDGLFVDVPDPTATHKIPAGSCKTLSHKLIDQAKSPFGTFDNYSVVFKVSRVAKTGKFRVKDFTDKATVHLKTD